MKQANAFEVAPGLRANGALGVTENLADVGGVAFGYGALQRYLKAHPKENRKIDGLTQEQRCFIAWAQLWSEKSREGYLRQVTATDAHAPGNYRVWAPAQHEPGFYKAFGMGAYPCIYCDHCVAEESVGPVDRSMKRLCRHMDKVRPSMEAACIDVFSTARNAWWELSTIPCKDLEYGKIVHANIVSLGLVLIE